MKKILLIIRREYLSRVTKRSFVIMTMLGPIFMASIWIIPFMLATQSEGTKVIEVLDETGIFLDQFKDSENTHFVYIFDDIRTAKENLQGSENFAILHIPKKQFAIPSSAILYSNSKPGLGLKTYLSTSINEILEEKKLLDNYGITGEDLASVKTNVSLVIKDIETGESSFTEVSWALGFISGMLIYMFIFMYGSQVMRGVIEEKTSRIVEVIMSSVKPIQLMMGKIVGIAMVGLTQFLLWVILTLGIITAFTTVYADEISNQNPDQEMVDPGQLFADNPVSSQSTTEGIDMMTGDSESLAQLLDVLYSINYGIIISMFLFYFVGGYLLYAALFAAIGSAVDSEADTQQFMMPITVPLILSLVIGLSFVLNNPDGQVAYWLSLIPFTSPIIMMIRIPFGVDIMTELIPSMLLLIAGFLLTTWLAAKIYRTGILMYGKRVNYKELWKWISYR